MINTVRRSSPNEGSCQKTLKAKPRQGSKAVARDPQFDFDGPPCGVKLSIVLRAASLFYCYVVFPFTLINCPFCHQVSKGLAGRRWMPVGSVKSSILQDGRSRQLIRRVVVGFALIKVGTVLLLF